jgi:biopolymer transport protein ExbD
MNRNRAPIHLKPLPEPRLEILNLIDILITLVAFFMLTSTFVTEQSHQGIGVDLPRVRHDTILNNADTKLVLELHKDHQIFFQGQGIGFDRLKELFQRQAPDTVLTIRADQDCRYSWVVELLDLAAAYKLDKVALEVRK